MATTRDSSGLNRHGELAGASPPVSIASPFTGYGRAYRFGVDSRIDCGTGFTVNTANGSFYARSRIVIEGGAGTNRKIFECAGPGGYNYILYVNSSNGLTFLVNGTGGTSGCNIGTPGTVAGSMLVEVEWDGATVEMRVDGGTVASAAMTTMTLADPLTTVLTIGAEATGANHFVGVIDEVELTIGGVVQGMYHMNEGWTGALYWIGATPGNASDPERWSLTSGGEAAGVVPTDANDVFTNGDGVGTLTIDTSFSWKSFTRVNAHTGGVVFTGSGSLNLAVYGDIDLGSDGQVVNGTPLISIPFIIPQGTAASIGGVSAVTVFIIEDGSYTGNLTLRSASAADHLLGSHSGTLTLEQDASVVQFTPSGARPTIYVNNSVSGSALAPGVYNQVSVTPFYSGTASFILTSGIISIESFGLVNYTNGNAVSGTVTNNSDEVVIRNTIVLRYNSPDPGPHEELIWEKRPNGASRIVFDGTNTSYVELGSTLAPATPQHLDRIEIESATHTGNPAFADGLRIRSGSTFTFSQNITLDLPTDGAFFIEAGGQVSSIAGRTVIANAVDMNGVGPGGTLNLDAASAFTVNAPSCLARYATMRNCVATQANGIATDCVDLGGNTGWTFVTTPPVVPSTRLYLRTDNSTAPHTVPGSEFNKVLSPILAGTPTNQSMSTGILSNDNSGYGFSAAMNNAAWQAGSTTVPTNVTNGDSDVKLRARVARVNSLGVVQQTSGYSSSVTASTGIKTLTVPTITWTAGATTDVLRVEYEVDNGALAQTIQIGLNNADTYVETPVIMAVGSTKSSTRKNLEMVGAI